MKEVIAESAAREASSSRQNGNGADKKENNLLKRIRKGWIGYLFVTPLVIVIAIFCIYPPVSGLYHSFYEWDVNGSTFVGFAQFRQLFSDELFLKSVPVMFELMLPKLIIGIVAPFIMAELIFSLNNKELQGVFRILILLPIVAPGVVSTLIWKNIYSADGLMTSICQLLGIAQEGATVDWFDSSHIIFSLIFMGFPWVGGTSVLIYMSGLMSISSEVFEAARLDGCSTLRRIFCIDIPLLFGQIRYFLVFGIIGSMQDYSAQIVLTEGEPLVPGYYMYKNAFGFGKLGYACTIGTVLFGFILLITSAVYVGTGAVEKRIYGDER